MASKQQHDEQELRGGVLAGNGSPTLWGALIGLIAFAFVAVPISTAVSFATHPISQALFVGERLAEASPTGYSIFWWTVALILIAIPILLGWGVAKLSTKTIVIIGSIVIVLFVLILIFGQVFLF